MREWCSYWELMLFSLTVKFYQDVRTNICKKQLAQSLTNASLDVWGFKHHKGPSYKVEHNIQDN